MPFWSRDPKKKLQRQYEAAMREAKEAEKLADRALQAELYAKAADLLAQIDALEAR